MVIRRMVYRPAAVFNRGRDDPEPLPHRVRRTDEEQARADGDGWPSRTSVSEGTRTARLSAVWWPQRPARLIAAASRARSTIAPKTSARLPASSSAHGVACRCIQIPPTYAADQKHQAQGALREKPSRATGPASLSSALGNGSQHRRATASADASQPTMKEVDAVEAGSTAAGSKRNPMPPCTSAKMPRRRSSSSANGSGKGSEPMAELRAKTPTDDDANARSCSSRAAGPSPQLVVRNWHVASDARQHRAVRKSSPHGVG